MRIHRSRRRKFENKGRLKDFSDGLCIMALSVFKKKHDGCSGNRKILPPQILLMRLKIPTKDFAEIEAVMRNSPSCLNGLVL